MFKTYDQKIKLILTTKPGNINWKQTLEDHQRMISFIQHERLIHLLVTIFVGLVMSASAFTIFITKSPEILLLCIPLVILFMAYLFHYRFLENTTQGWYLLEEKIKKNSSLN